MPHRGRAHPREESHGSLLGHRALPPSRCSMLCAEWRAFGALPCPNLGALCPKWGIRFADRFNIVVAPCVSPWGYETIQRWNNNAEDPNRGFYEGSSRDECAAVQSLVESLGGPDAFAVHLDLYSGLGLDFDCHLSPGACRVPWHVLLTF